MEGRPAKREPKKAKVARVLDVSEWPTVVKVIPGRHVVPMTRTMTGRRYEANQGQRIPIHPDDLETVLGLAESLAHKCAGCGGSVPATEPRKIFMEG
jgi:hypothetical protein